MLTRCFSSDPWLPIMLIMCTPFIITVTVPSSHSVECGPTEKINRRITEATNVLIPGSLGSVTTIASEINMIDQISSDKWPPNSGTLLSNGWQKATMTLIRTIQLNRMLLHSVM